MKENKLNDILLLIETFMDSLSFPENNNLRGQIFMISDIRLESENLIIRSSTFDDCKYFDEWERKDYVKRFLMDTIMKKLSENLF